MYFVVESPQNLTVPINDMANVKSLKANRDNMFICSITGNYIMIWFTTTSMLIAFHQRADDSISIHGENHLVEWNNDSSKIAVMTTKGYLIYYKITFENEFVISDLSYAQSAWNDTLFSNKVQYKNPLLACRITHDFSIHIQHAQKNISCFNEEIFISLLNGKLIKVPWNDQARHDHFYLSLQKIYFKTETDGELFKLKENVYITEFELSVDYCFNCLAAVLSDSTAVYIISDSTNSFRGLVAKANNRNLSYRCVAINPLYKIVAFGCKNGIAVAFNQPDDYTQLQVSNYYVQSTKENDNSNVTHMRWSPDYNALAILYDNGTFSVFSVFGCLLYDSRELFSESGDVYNFVRTMEFGIDGYSLWLFVQSLEQNINGNLYRLKMLKSSSLNNCSMSNIEHISLNGEREVYVCLNLSKQSAAAASQKMQLNDATRQQSPPPGIVYPTLKLGGNTMWQVLNVPLTYIASNFPIRMSSIDTEGKHLAVAGVRGFTHYSFATRKWKMFGNAEQEKDIRITGGLLWWREFICMCCHNLVDQRDEIRFYSKNTNLDNSYAKISKTTCGILQMNIFNNLLVLFGIDCRIQVLGLEGGKDTTSKIILNKLIEIQVDSYVFRNPYLVVAVSLCPLYIGNYEDSLKKTIESNSSTMKSILINVAGNLLMFQPDLDSLLSIPEDLNKTKPFSSLPPIIIASCVENYWVVANNTRTKLINHFMNLSLWINCGFNGIKVWLPLSGDDNEVKQSTRIILTFPLNFYPLGLLINDALLIGAASENTSFSHNSYYQIQKTTQLFMPFVLEGLIRKGLSVDAKKLALGYRYLPYFLHILELLIHKILEEEAHSSEQSNRILPKVIEFISQFPEHLKIISHCTRKSEVAVWPYLFSIVGTSQLLFEKCLSQKDLETAASYLVVLQNTENSKTCEKLANMLLKASLKNGDWNLVKEIMRFISSIDPADFDSGEVFEFQSYGGGIISNSAATTAGEQSSQSPPPSAHSLHNSSSSPMAFKLNKTPTSATTTTTTTTPGSGNRSSISMTSPASKKTNETTTSTTNTTPKTVNMSTSSVTSNSTLKQRLSLNEFELSRRSIELTVHEYAMDLLKAYRVRRLFEMFSQLGFLNVFKWLEQYQSVALIENFVQAVSSVHFEFNWPYPIMINEFKKTNSFITPICEVVSGVVAKKNSNGNVSLTLTENTTPKVATALKKETSDPNINPALKTSSTKRPQPPSNLPLIGSDFIYDSPPNQAKSIANGNGSSNNITSQEENEPTTPENEDPSSFDFDLVSQQLAATSGSQDSKNKLYYIVETFTSCRCYEWVFVLALVLQNFSVLSEIARKMRDGSLPPDVVKSLRKGLEQLDDWSQNECCGYREIIKKLVDVI